MGDFDRLIQYGPDIPPAVMALLIRAGVRALFILPSKTFFDALSQFFQDPAYQEHGRVLYWNAANFEPQDVEPVSAPGADGQNDSITPPVIYDLIQYDLSLEERAKQPGYRKPVVVIVLDEIINASPKTLTTLLNAINSHDFRNVSPVFIGVDDANRIVEPAYTNPHLLEFYNRNRFFSISWRYQTDAFQSFVYQTIFNLVADGLAAEEEEGNREKHVLEAVSSLKNKIEANVNGKDGYSKDIASFIRFLNRIQRWTIPSFHLIENFNDYLDIVSSVAYRALKKNSNFLLKQEIANGALPDSRNLIEHVLFPVAIVLAARSSPEWQPYINDMNINEIVRAILNGASMPWIFSKEFLSLWTTLSSSFAKKVPELLADEYVAGQRPLPAIIHNNPIHANTCADIIYQIAENPKMVAYADLGRPYHDEQHKQRDIIRRLFKLLTQIRLEDPDTWIKAKITKLDRFERAICDIFLLNHILSGECKAYKEGTYDLYRYKFLEKILSRASRDDVAQMESSFVNFAELLLAENPEHYALPHDLAEYIMDRSCNPITHTALAQQDNQKIHANPNQYIPSWSCLQHYAYGLFVPAHLYYASVAYMDLYHAIRTNGEKDDLTMEDINKLYEDILNTDPVFRLFSAGDEQGFIAAITDNPVVRLKSSLLARIPLICTTLRAFCEQDDFVVEDSKIVIEASKPYGLLEQCRQQQLALCSAQIAL